MNDLLDRELFKRGVSAELADSLALADRGLMRAPPAYRQWMARMLSEGYGCRAMVGKGSK